jgi:hypothetical protein
MRPLVFLILLLVASSALAGDLVMKNEANGATLRLMDTPAATARRWRC